MNIIITGASSGIGYQTALLFAKDKSNKVVAISRNKKKLARLKNDSLKSGMIDNLLPIDFDLSEANFEKLVIKIKKYFSKVDILINNAGNLVNKPFEKLNDDDWRSIYEVNVFGTVRMIRTFIPMMKSPSHILNISSMGGFQGAMKFKGLSAYSSSKAALINITECLAEELKEKNIRVNCLALGSVQTEMFTKAFPKSKAASSASEMAAFIVDFAVNGRNLFNGKVLPVSAGTP